MKDLLRMKQLNMLKVTGSFVVATMLVMGCNNSKQANQAVQNNTPKVDSTNSTLLRINNQIFSIPSPIQTALLIKKSGYSYNKAILNNSANYSKYDTKYKKALNLGIYGADLGYISLYDQTQDALSYLASVEKLATDVGVANVFDAGLIKRFQQNMGKQDSLLAMVSEAFRRSDAYFKDNRQNDVSSLVLIGGWVESLHFAIEANMQNGQKDVMSRIAEQKISLQNLVKMLQPYASKPEFSELAKSLSDLSGLFDNVEFVYNYIPPTVDVKTKTTSINSTSNVKISPEQLKEISDKVQAIRNQITG
ncbi:MAG TPA: hypothetical protein VK806_13560 [Bacteroidia bacterium]|jgi:hypothetical protein|nr:hypothetical protein [Bacteroidia bacterium]